MRKVISNLHLLDEREPIDRLLRNRELLGNEEVVTFELALDIYEKGGEFPTLKFMREVIKSPAWQARHEDVQDSVAGFLNKSPVPLEKPSEVIASMEMDLDLRRRETASQRLLEASSSTMSRDVSEIIEELRTTAESLQSAGTFRIEDYQFKLEKFWEDMVKDADGLKTGTPVDQQVSSLSRGTTATIAAYTSQFKTTWAVNIVYHGIMEGKSGGFLTLEVPEKFIHLMLLCIHSFYLGKPLNYSKVRLGRDELTEEENEWLHHVSEDFEEKRKGQVYIMDDPKTWRETLYKLDKEDDLYFFVYDHLQLSHYAQTESQKRHNNDSYVLGQTMYEIAEVSRTFRNKGLACIVLSQVNRKGYERAVERKGLYDLLALGDCTEIERSSYFIMFSYSDPQMREDGEALITLAKNRGGKVLATDPVPISVFPSASVFGSIDDNVDDGLAEEHDISDFSILNPDQFDESGKL